MRVHKVLDYEGFLELSQLIVHRVSEKKSTRNINFSSISFHLHDGLSLERGTARSINEAESFW